MMDKDPIISSALDIYSDESTLEDQFGDILANGVYLYRVKAKIDGKDIELLDSGADQYFHKGLGKMYIIR